MIPSLKLTCETLGLGWMSLVLGFGLLAGSMWNFGECIYPFEGTWDIPGLSCKGVGRMFFFLDTGHETHPLSFHCHEHVSHVTEAKLSRETLRHVQFQTQWCYTWSTTKSHSKITCFFFVLEHRCPRVSPKAWANEPKSDGQVYFPKYFDKNAKSLAITSARCWARNTLLFWPENQDALDWYTSHFFFGGEFFAWFDQRYVQGNWWYDI